MSGTSSKNVVNEFREKFRGGDQIVKSIQEGLKHSNAKVRALAAKAALRTQDHGFLKSNVFPLLEQENNKRVLRAVVGKIYRKSWAQKLEQIIAARPKAEKKVAPAEEVPAEESKADGDGGEEPAA